MTNNVPHTTQDLNISAEVQYGSGSVKGKRNVFVCENSLPLNVAPRIYKPFRLGVCWIFDSESSV